MKGQAKSPAEMKTFSVVYSAALLEGAERNAYAGTTFRPHAVEGLHERSSSHASDPQADELLGSHVQGSHCHQSIHWPWPQRQHAPDMMHAHMLECRSSEHGSRQASTTEKLQTVLCPAGIKAAHAFIGMAAGIFLEQQEA